MQKDLTHCNTVPAEVVEKHHCMQLVSRVCRLIHCTPKLTAIGGFYLTVFTISMFSFAALCVTNYNNNFGVQYAFLN